MKTRIARWPQTSALSRFTRSCLQVKVIECSNAGREIRTFNSGGKFFLEMLFARLRQATREKPGRVPFSGGITNVFMEMQSVAYFHCVISPKIRRHFRRVTFDRTRFPRTLLFCPFSSRGRLDLFMNHRGGSVIRLLKLSRPTAEVERTLAGACKKKKNKKKE